ncbi:hypothetical protein D3C84_1065980 [compost metagenome]|jgi:hypothetical protein
MKIDRDKPSKVNGVALTLAKKLGCRVSTSTMTQASNVTIRLRKAIRLAIEPLSALRMLIRLGLGLTIMVVYLRRCSP